jgi:hypothetical protein
VIAGDRIGQHVELKERLGESLRAQSRRALPAIAETDGNGVALAHETAHHFDIQRAVPRTGVLLVVEACLQDGAVRRLDRHEAGAAGIVELWFGLIRSEPKADFDAAGIVNAEPARRVDDDEGLP